jgi:hypothetical protein
VAVCVDVTPLKKVDTQYGPKEKFRLVFEVDQIRSDGKRFAVWSQGFTPSCHEKSGFRKFLKDWFGRDLTESEWDTFDTEGLLHRPASLIIINEHDGDKTYANIKLIEPLQPGQVALRPSGQFVRAKDRPEKGDKGSSLRAVQQPTAPAQQGEDPNWGGHDVQSGAAAMAGVMAPSYLDCKVHVGRNIGLSLRELTPEAVAALVEKWLPAKIASNQYSADDKRLVAALQEWDAARLAALAAKSDGHPANELPY